VSKEMKKLLIIDDEPIVRRAVHRVLKDLPVEIQECTNGKEAIDLMEEDLKNKENEISLLCLDWLMPIASGRDVLEWKSASQHPAQVMIMTAYGSNQINQEIADFKVDHVMTKPFENIVAVREAVKSFL
jgi:CheY-like chemotaxis protein